MADVDEGEAPNNETMLSPEATEEQATPGLQNRKKLWSPNIDIMV